MCPEAYERLSAEGIKERVVSMPSWELFDDQPPEYRDQVLPPEMTARVSIEQASTFDIGPSQDGKRRENYTMATVTVLKFPTADGAVHALHLIQELQKSHLIKLHDAAIVSWSAGKKSPKTWQAVDLVGAGAMSGMFWGLLFGMLFFSPLIGMAVGAAFGALSGAFRDYGIDDDFIKQIRGKITEGTSGLFLLTSDAVLDRVAEVMSHVKFEIVSTNLSLEQEEKAPRGVRAGISSAQGDPG